MEVLLNNGLKMPMVGLGTHLLRDVNKCKSLITSALKCGYKLIDTASVYENEEAIGSVINENNLKSLNLKRDQVFITTKLSPSDHGTGSAERAARESIDRLQVTNLDMMLIHWPGVTGLDLGDSGNSKLRRETWSDLEKLVKEGKINSIGVSNYTQRHLIELMSHCTIKPVVNQVEFHPFCFQKDLLDFCSNQKIFLQAYSSLGSANGWDDLKENQNLIQIAGKKKKTIAQILLKWALNHGVGVIPKTSKEKNLKSNLDLFSFDLDQHEMNMINDLNRNHRYSWDPNQVK